MAGVPDFAAGGAREEWQKFAQGYAKAGWEKEPDFAKKSAFHARELVKTAKPLMDRLSYNEAIAKTANIAIEKATKEGNAAELEHVCQALYSLGPDILRELKFDKANNSVQWVVAKFLYNCPHEEKYQNRADALWQAFSGKQEKVKAKATAEKESHAAEAQALKTKREGIIIKLLTKEGLTAESLLNCVKSLKGFSPQELRSLLEKLDIPQLMPLVGHLEDKSEKLLFEMLGAKFSRFTPDRREEFIEHLKADAKGDSPYKSSYQKLVEHLDVTDWIGELDEDMLGLEVVSPRKPVVPGRHIRQFSEDFVILDPKATADDINKLDDEKARGRLESLSFDALLSLVEHVKGSKEKVLFDLLKTQSVARCKEDPFYKRECIMKINRITDGLMGGNLKTSLQSLHDHLKKLR